MVCFSNEADHYLISSLLHIQTGLTAFTGDFLNELSERSQLE